MRKAIYISSLLFFSQIVFADAITDSNPALLRKLEQRRQDRVIIENRLKGNGERGGPSTPSTTIVGSSSTTTTVVSSTTTTTKKPTTTIVNRTEDGESVRECYQSATVTCDGANFQVDGYDYNNASSNPKPYKCCKKMMK